MKHLFILKDATEYRELESIIQEVLNNEAIIHYTNNREEVAHIIEQYKKPIRVYSVGGDGTVNLMMQPLVNTDHQLVILPLGTGNDFLRMLTDERDFKTLLEMSKTSSVERIDTVKVNDRYFINTACFGIDAVIANHVHDDTHFKFVPKSKRYILSIIKNVLKYPFYDVEISDLGKLVYKGKITLFTVNNGQYYGGGFKPTPHSDIHDGKFEVLLVEEMPFRSIPYYIKKLVDQKLNGVKRVHFSDHTTLDVKINESMNLDGDEVRYDHYHFEVVPQSLNIISYKKEK